MKIKPIIPILLFVVLAVGCKSVQPIADGTPSIVIKKLETRKSGLGHITFPVGIYTPDFQIKEGVYYLAPTKLIAGGLGMNRPQRGGLFIPKPDAPNQKKAGWFDQQEGSGGLFGAAVTSTTRLWRFDEPIPYEIQK